MATLGFIEYVDAPSAVKAVYDDIMTSRQTDYINNFWKALAHDPVTLRRTWESVKQIMAPGALDPLTKELVYLASRFRDWSDICHLAKYLVIGQMRTIFQKACSGASKTRRPLRGAKLVNVVRTTCTINAVTF